VDSSLGERAMYPCVRRECACAGVFFKDHGGASSKLRLRVWIESTPATTTSNPTCPPTAAASVSPDAAKRLADVFRTRKPEATLFPGGDTPSEVISSTESRTWAPDANRLGGGVWDITFRPSRITGDATLAQIKVTLGVNELYTPGFEVRTKPSDWLLLQRIPATWKEADVRAFVAECADKKPCAVVIRRDTVLPAAGAGAGAGAGSPKASSDAAAALCAFVRFANRPAACGVLAGFKSKLRVKKGKKSSSSLTGASRNVIVSLIASLNRMFGYDTALDGALAPPCDILEVVQKQERPSFLPAPEAPAAVVAPAPAVAAPVKRPLAISTPSPVAALDEEEEEEYVPLKRHRCVMTPAAGSDMSEDEEEAIALPEAVLPVALPVAVPRTLHRGPVTSGPQRAVAALEPMSLPSPLAAAGASSPTIAAMLGDCPELPCLDDDDALFAEFMSGADADTFLAGSAWSSVFGSGSASMVM